MFVTSVDLRNYNNSRHFTGEEQSKQPISIHPYHRLIGFILVHYGLIGPNYFKKTKLYVLIKLTNICTNIPYNGIDLFF